MILSIGISNLTQAQAIAIEDFLHQWEYLGHIGASRWTAFFADGDGNFRPKVFVNGYTARACNLIPSGTKWRSLADKQTYCIDYDEIAWALRADPAAPTQAKPHAQQSCLPTELL